jgi:hypothetical protein
MYWLFDLVIRTGDQESYSRSTFAQQRYPDLPESNGLGEISERLYRISKKERLPFAVSGHSENNVGSL